MAPRELNCEQPYLKMIFKEKIILPSKSNCSLPPPIGRGLGRTGTKKGIKKINKEVASFLIMNPFRDSAIKNSFGLVLNTDLPNNCQYDISSYPTLRKRF